MARNARRLQTLQRQHRIAVIARREAIGALANAQADETQSANLAERSKTLARTYSGSVGEVAGSDLAQSSRFASSLAGIASEAERSRALAADERGLAAQKLAQREQRLERLDEHLASEKREQNRTVQLREIADQAMLARKLLR